VPVLGSRPGQGIVGIDADTMNLELASLIQMTAVKHFGLTPCRVGRFPKVLYLVRSPRDEVYPRRVRRA